MQIIIGNIKISLKQRIEDFQVDEVVDFEVQDKGDFGVYLLKKWGATTWDVVGDLKKRLRRSYREISYVGIKDKQAITSQYITILHGPKKDLKGKNYLLKYLGQADRPIGRKNLRGNKFKIKIKVDGSLSTKSLYDEVDRVSRFGLVNYFDDQRFVSVDHTGRLAAKELVLKRYERALYQLLVYSSHYEAKRTKAFRECLEKNCGDFSRCLSYAPSSWEKKVISFLARNKSSNTTYKKALSLVDKEYLFFLCNVYQSYLWNKVCLEFLNAKGILLLKVKGRIFDYGFYLNLKEGTLNFLKETYIPLPGPKISVNNELRELFNNILKKEGIPCIEALRTRIKGGVFKSSLRSVVVFPKIYSWEEVKKGRWECEFFLPKGSYATLVIRRIFGLCGGLNEREI